MNNPVNQEHATKKQKKHSFSCGPEPEPDVVVKVGGTEFLEYSYALRTWSRYFDGAFRRTEMNQPGRFEFPARDPEEWKLIKELTAPFAKAQINKDNVFKMLPWFDEFCCKAGLEQCDEFLINEVIPALFPKEELKKTEIDVVQMIAELSHDPDTTDESYIAACFNLDPFLDAATESIRFGLDQSTKKCIGVLEQIVSKAPHLLFVSMARITKMVTMMKENHECRERLWGKMEMECMLQIETNESTVTKDELLANPLLPTLLSNNFMVRTYSGALGEMLHRAEKFDVLKKDEKLGPLIHAYREK